MLIAGAGMAGLVAAARLRELGVDAEVVEKGNRVGGSMLISSGVIWRHRDWDDFRAECPRGDEDLQALVWGRLDESLDWLVALGSEPVADHTGNPRTIGKRFDPRALTEVLARRADVRLQTSFAPESAPPVILATGGFGRRLSEERRLLLRANAWSAGDALDWALSRGATATTGMGEFYGRAMPARPARIREEDFVPLAQLYGREARVFTDDGKDITPPSVAWHENDLVQLIGPSAWYVVEHTNERIEAARAAGGTVKVWTDGRLAVHVSAAVTHTIGGLRIDRNARVVGLDGVWAAGVDAGGVATGGYSSGLAQALVLGLAAAENAAAIVL